MTRAYLDTHYLYLHHSDPRAMLAAWRDRVVAEVGADRMVISALVVDELAYRMAIAWLRDDGDRDPLTTYRRAPGENMRRMASRLEKLWRDIAELQLDIASAPVLESAKRMMTDPGLAPRDAFHAAHALASRCEIIVSIDSDFDRVAGLRRLGPRG